MNTFTKPFLYFFLKLNSYVRFTLILIALVIFSSLVLFFLERNTFTSIFDALWFSVVTVFTVGYGDLSPNTPAAKLITIALIVFGSIVISYVNFSIASLVAHNQEKLQDGAHHLQISQHLIFVGWNEKTHLLSRRLLEQNKRLSIVIIDRSIKKLPLVHNRLYFVRGSSTEDDTWHRASIETAKGILISADQNSNERTADLNTTMSALVVKNIQPNCFCIAEILTREQVKNAERCGVDIIIETYNDIATRIEKAFEQFYCT
ncbi:MAG: ion channel [Bacilli bacterium]